MSRRSPPLHKTDSVLADLSIFSPNLASTAMKADHAARSETSVFTAGLAQMCYRRVNPSPECLLLGFGSLKNVHITHRMYEPAQKSAVFAPQFHKYGLTICDVSVLARIPVASKQFRARTIGLFRSRVEKRSAAIE